MKILMLNYEFPPIGGGAANAHLSLLKQYTQNTSLNIDVLTSAPKPGSFEENFSENITIYKVGIHKKKLHHWRKIEVLEWLFKAKPRYNKMLKNTNYDLVHAFFGFPSGWLCYKSKDKLPYIISLRGSDVPGQHARLKLDYKILAPTFKAIWKNAATLIACSEGLKQRALKFLPSVAIDVIPNGVDTERFNPPQTKKIETPLKLLTVGRLSITKRVELLIDTVQILHNAGHKIHFTIVGSGGLEKQLRKLVLEKNLSCIIEFTSRIDPQQMPQIYQQNDVFISATSQEGMSNAMLEAMASALPIITTRCEGADELIADNGIIVEQPNAQIIADTIKKLADNPNLYETMCLQAKKQAENFNWKTTADKYFNCYEKIMQKTT